MLDVHPPHAPTHTWRDFFIHIATIVIGLLIAVGLEQSVEYLHHRRELMEAREALRSELQDNLLGFQANVASYRLNRALLRTNLAVFQYLQQHPGTPEENLPGVLNWKGRYETVVDAAWKLAQQNSITMFMPRREATDLDNTYAALRSADAAEEDLWLAINVATRATIADPNPSHLTPAQVEKEIELTETCISQNHRWGIALENVNEANGLFSPYPSLTELDAEVGYIRSAADMQKLAAALHRAEQESRSETNAFNAAESAVAARARSNQ